MASGKTSEKIARLVWGRMEGMELSVRVSSLVFVVVAITAMSFCQLGFWPIGVIDGKSVYLLLVLAPLVMSAFMYGPLTGALLGLYSGAVAFAHAAIIPLDYYEFYFMTPFNTFVLLTLIGALSGLLFDLVLRRNSKGAVRFGLIALVCIALSFVASALMMVGVVLAYGGSNNIDDIREFLFNSPKGVAVQALVDAALMVVLCYAADALMRMVSIHVDNHKLLYMFRSWMLAVAGVVFMLASAIAFTATTILAEGDAKSDMQSEVDYLAKQADSLDGTNYGALLDGYSVQADGYVVIVDNSGIILATDDNGRYPIGKSFFELAGFQEQESDGKSGAVGSYLDMLLREKSIGEIPTVDDHGGMTMEYSFMAAAKANVGYTVMIRSAEMVYANRLSIMIAITSIAILLIAAVSILATVLMNRLVLRRVDDTNVSLGKITEGDLNERVNVRGSREFASLSHGVNTMVSALKDTIREVERRNEQDLVAAKAIQESALPREFPPFPDIDRFDIYASMKTAKEVGGDFYDFFLVDEGKLAFLVADVSGKGIPAALFMMTAKTQLRTYLESGLPVDEAVNAANHQLCNGNDAGMFVTAWIGVLDYGCGELEFVNAGHNPPLLYSVGDAGGSAGDSARDMGWRWVREVSGMPLGLFDGIPYDKHAHLLAPGDALYVYTDGVTEAMDAGGSLFGEDRLLEALGVYAGENARTISVGIRRALTDFAKGAEQSDDITMLALRYGVPPEARASMTLPADVGQLVHVHNFIHEELHRRGAPKSAYNPLDIAAEELFVNVCHYAYPDNPPDDPGEARVEFEYEANPPSLTVAIVDDGVPYNPLAKPDAVTPDDIMEVPIGGLGILMAKNSVDEMTYERVGGSNVLTFRKGW